MAPYQPKAESIAGKVVGAVAGGIVAALTVIGGAVYCGLKKCRRGNQERDNGPVASPETEIVAPPSVPASPTILTLSEALPGPAVRRLSESRPVQKPASPQRRGSYSEEAKNPQGEVAARV
jgi:hypothetical protein